MKIDKLALQQYIYIMITESNTKGSELGHELSKITNIKKIIYQKL